MCLRLLLSQENTTHTHSTALHAATAQRQNNHYAIILIQRFDSDFVSRLIVVYYCYLNRNAHLTDDRARPNGGKSLATCIPVTVRLNPQLAMTNVFHIYPPLLCANAGSSPIQTTTNSSPIISNSRNHFHYTTVTTCEHTTFMKIG